MKALFASSRAGGALALFVLLVFLTIGGLLVGHSVVDTTQLELDARATELEALQKRLQVPVRAAAAPSENVANAFLDGANLTLAANTLQQRVVASIDSNGGALTTVGVEPPDANDDPVGRRVAVQASAEFENDGLQSFLYEMESERPFLIVDTLDIRRSSKTVADAKPGEEKPQRLAVSFRILGYYRRAAR